MHAHFGSRLASWISLDPMQLGSLFRQLNQFVSAPSVFLQTMHDKTSEKDAYSFVWLYGTVHTFFLKFPLSTRSHPCLKEGSVCQALAISAGGDEEMQSTGGKLVDSKCWTQAKLDLWTAQIVSCILKKLPYMLHISIYCINCTTATLSCLLYWKMLLCCNCV